MTAPEAVRVSIVVPVRDGERFVGPAIDSLLRGDRPADEVVVVDDHSSDASAAVARDRGVLVVASAGTGPAAARNTGVAASTGDLVGFLDADDLATPARLSIQAGLLHGDDALDAVAGLARNFTDDPAAPGEELRTFAPGTLLLRRATWERVGPLDESLAAGEMVDWVARSRRLGIHWGPHDDLVLLRRVHGTNLSGSDAAKAGYLDLARAAVRRSREGRP